MRFFVFHPSEAILQPNAPQGFFVSHHCEAMTPIISSIKR
jgi:hypothetical protein